MVVWSVYCNNAGAGGGWAGEVGVSIKKTQFGLLIAVLVTVREIEKGFSPPIFKKSVA